MAQSIDTLLANARSHCEQEIMSDADAWNEADIYFTVVKTTDQTGHKDMAMIACHACHKCCGLWTGPPRSGLQKRAATLKPRPIPKGFGES